jgi:hypothetical protein
MRCGIVMCAECDPCVPQRIEKIVVPLLISQTHPPSALDDVHFGGIGCDAAPRRPDTLWLGQDRVVSLEIDERSHEDRITSCELAKMHDQFVAWQALVGCVPVFYVRFNPDAFDGGIVSLEERIRVAARRVNELLTMDVAAFTTLVPHVEFLYYHSNAKPHIDGVRDASESFVLLGRY